MEFDLIIPAKNEERLLERYLLQIKQQTSQPRNIIVADASTDRTAEIARKYGAIVVEGNDQGYIGKARNNGAEHATSEVLVFSDADNSLPDNYFFEKLITSFENRDLDFASCLIKSDRFSITLSTNLVFRNFIKRVANLIGRPIVEMEALLISKKEAHDKVGGFNEDIRFGEGELYFHSLQKNGYKYGVIPLYIKTYARKHSILYTLKIVLLGNLYWPSLLLGKNMSLKLREMVEKAYWDKSRDLRR